VATPIIPCVWRVLSKNGDELRANSGGGRAKKKNRQNGKKMDKGFFGGPFGAKGERRKEKEKKGPVVQGRKMKRTEKNKPNRTKNKPSHCLPQFNPIRKDMVPAKPKRKKRTRPNNNQTEGLSEKK